VTIPDANILLYASDTSSRQHPAARAWLERALSGTDSVGLAIVVVLAFVRIATNPRIMAAPLSPRAAFEQLEEWLAQPPAILVQPGRRHLRICRGLLEASGTAGNLTTDAHLAALAIEHGATLASFDGDFHRFSGLKLEYLG
jgi:uncharacterized protein